MGVITENYRQIREETHNVGYNDIKLKNAHHIQKISFSPRNKSV